MSLPATFGLLVMALVGSVGCGDAGEAETEAVDAGADGEGGTRTVVTPPEIPWLVEGVPPAMLAPCPDGWRAVRGGDVVECDPYPLGGAHACDMGEAHFPGEPGCRPIGDECPTGDYGRSLPTSGSVVHVMAAAPVGGDGTRDAPFATLADVPWVSLVGGTTVALGRGIYPGVLRLKAGVEVLGACARDTVVTGLPAPIPFVVTVTTAGEPAVVRNLTIRSASQSGAVAESGRHLALRGVLLEEVRGTGVLVSGAGTQLTLTDVVIRDTEASGTRIDELGIGIRLRDGASLEARRLVLRRTRVTGIQSNGEGTRAELMDVVVMDTMPHHIDQTLGRGINVPGGGQLHATRLLVAGNREVGVYVAGARTTMRLVDAVVRGTEAQMADGAGGSGIQVVAGAELSALRLLVADNRHVGLLLNRAGARGLLTDVVIRGTRPQARDAKAGWGLGVQLGARCDARRLVVTDNAGAGIAAFAAGTTLSLADAVVQRTTPTITGPPVGFGIVAAAGVGVDATRLLVTRNQGLGIMAMDPGTTVDLSDAVILDTHSEPNERVFGRGLQAQTGASLMGRRLEIRRSHQFGVVALAGATVAVEDIVVRGVEVADCAATRCSAARHGHGVGTFSAAVSLRRFEVTESATCGVMLAPLEGSTEATSLDLEEGLVSEAEIGACVQLAGYDFDSLTNDVQYRNNESNLSATMLPVPGLVGGVGP